MKSQLCADCGTEIAPGLAVVRSTMFETVAFHRECWALRLLPAQRRSPEMLAEVPETTNPPEAADERGRTDQE